MHVQTSGSKVNMLAEDDFGIVYLIENAQQFWSELDDVLRVPSDGSATLSMLDTALRRFVSLCASYHEQFLQSPMQLEHACSLLLDSELFVFHSERMCELAIEDVESKTDPHSQLILYSVLLFHGRRQSNFIRSHKHWQPLIPLLMDHVLVEINLDTEDVYLGAPSISSSSGSRSSMVVGHIPIEAKLRSLSLRLLYEVCRVQKLSLHDLNVFNDQFLDNLFELIEQTRFMPDETLNYSVIKLIVALNEQFMVACLSNNQQPGAKEPELQNRVLTVLISRLGSSKTFGENMIFMLNRASRSAEDLCMQLLVLKLLYILFTNKATSEYFYTNDLCVLVDVFLRELVDLDEESESLRHTYLRVMHPLLTKTQMRDVPYKRPQIVLALESLIQNGNIRDINPTTKRLVERCLGGEWCMQLRRTSHDKETLKRQGDFRHSSPSHDIIASTRQDTVSSRAPTSPDVEHDSASKALSSKPKVIKHCRSVESVHNPTSPRLPPPRSVKTTYMRSSPDSVTSLAAATIAASRRREKASSADDVTSAVALHPEKGVLVQQPRPPSSSSLNLPTVNHKVRRPAPAPPKRRKPPPVPVGTTNSGATITAIATSASTPALGQLGRSNKLACRQL
ncbi:hypothetical protein DFJ58DRAFT_406806 [Suillus subalutaceus]|uniref:uncharacterized protein n=1 Tax=Suillus subalutaceus TaxID=48586 RepID=UPI001B87280F|nr:uncharacterized protein DFJ58DRAFT_406806 [Suillus subalutaceus]KAG1872950.1 hypothetical protein DFJ58DRAFT_406806 [Suillus subalutaceus]